MNRMEQEMNSYKRIGLVAAVVMVVSVVSLNVFGADDENEVLRGLKGVFVEVHIYIATWNQNPWYYRKPVAGRCGAKTSDDRS